MDVHVKIDNCIEGRNEEEIKAAGHGCCHWSVKSQLLTMNVLLTRVT